MKNKNEQRWFFTKFFCENSEPSSKRLVGIIGSFTLFSALFANTLASTYNGNAPSESLINAVALLSFGALGITGFERVFGKKNSNSTTEQNVSE